MASVFLSYSREDRPRAQQVVAALEAGGCSVWWDGLIEGGARFSQATEAALDAAEVVVVLWSKTSVKSHWVHDEATRGRDRGRLVPASIDGSAPPLGFGQFQALDLSKWKGRPKAPEIDNLLHAIGIATGQPETAPPTPARAAGYNRRKLLIGGGAAMTVAGAGFGVWKAGLLGSAAAENSIAVLPFRNLSGDPAQDYFAEGIAEEIRNTLARNPLLKVIARASSSKFRERDEAISKIASKLQVENIIDGSVRRDGGSVRIAVQMIDGTSGATRWTDNFDKPFADLLEVQQQIADTVQRILNINMSGIGFKAETRVSGGTNDPSAFDAFLKGRAAFELFSLDGFLDGAKYFGQASTIDPDYAAAYSGQARCLANLSTESNYSEDSLKSLEKALALARKALDLAPDSPFVQIVLAATLSNNLLNREARAHFDAAYRISPRHLDVPTLYGLHQAYNLRFDLAEAAFQKAISVDSLNPRVWLSKVWLACWQEDYKGLLGLVDKVWQENPNFGSGDFAAYFRFVGWCGLGRYDEAEAAAKQAQDKTERDWELALISLRRGEDGPARQFVDRAQSGELTDFNSQNNLAMLFTEMGRKQDALTVLEKAIARRNPYMTRIRCEPLLTPLATEPRFNELLRRIGLID